MKTLTELLEEIKVRPRWDTDGICTPGFSLTQERKAHNRTRKKLLACVEVIKSMSAELDYIRETGKALAADELKDVTTMLSAALEEK